MLPLPSSLPTQAEDRTFSLLTLLPGQYIAVCFKNFSGLLARSLYPTAAEGDITHAFTLPRKSRWVRRQTGHKLNKLLCSTEHKATLSASVIRARSLEQGSCNWEQGRVLPSESFLPHPTLLAKPAPPSTSNKGHWQRLAGEGMWPFASKQRIFLLSPVSETEHSDPWPSVMLAQPLPRIPSVHRHKQVPPQVPGTLNRHTYCWRGHWAKSSACLLQLRVA